MESVHSMRLDGPKPTDTVVIGGGLTGLSAAITAARGGARVSLLEARATLGGRARTDEHSGYLRNEGPRALYLAGHGMKVLRALGVDPTGKSPVITGKVLRADGTMDLLPLGATALARTKLLGTRAKAELVATMGRMMIGNAGTHRNISFSQWLDVHTSAMEVRQVLEMMTRLSTYAADLDRLSAEAAIEQSRIGAKGVLYLDGGWSQLICALTEIALSVGVQICRGTSAQFVEQQPDGRWLVHLRTGELSATTVIAAGMAPSSVDALLGGASPAVGTWTANAVPVIAACLDVCLQRIPVPEQRFGLGLDRPWYLSFHTPYARLAPEGTGEVVHVAKYVPSAELGRTPAQDRAELEGVLDRMQPGWRDVLVNARYLHRMTVSHAIPAPGTFTIGGITTELSEEATRASKRIGQAQPQGYGRPTVDGAGIPGLLVAGDWVGAHGMLADAALHSGAEAGRRAAALAKMAA